MLLRYNSKAAAEKLLATHLTDLYDAFNGTKLVKVIKLKMMLKIMFVNQWEYSAL